MSADLQRFLTDRDLVGHPMASALLALAERIDTGRDGAAGIGSALRHLAVLLKDMERRPSAEIDVLDLIRIKRDAKMAGVPLELSLDQMRAIVAARSTLFLTYRPGGSPAEVEQ